MCAICGIIARAPLKAALVPLMRDTMTHRGPDDAGIWSTLGGAVQLGHRRLSIIDLSPTGHQPMSDGTGASTIVFNGELYNYQELRAELASRGIGFRGTSDTEVVLEAYMAWGRDCLARFNGMFAFALYDSRREELFLARDRAGEKPLYYRHVPGRFSFASELKGLMADPEVPRIIDRRALDLLFAFGSVPGSHCILKGVHKLPPGAALVYRRRDDALETWRYWNLPEQAAASADEMELLDEARRLLTDSVRRRLVADVPLGVLLSGGLDSSIVTGLAAQLSQRPVRTFTVSFPGHGSLDESPHARIVARHFGTEHTELAAEQPTFDLLPLLARQFDEPLGDHSILPTYLVSKLIRQHAKVALGGDGGDELFCGYPHSNYIPALEHARAFVPSVARRAVGALARELPLGTRGRHHLLGFAADVSQSVAHVNLYFDRFTRGRLLSPLGPSLHSGAAEEYKAALCTPGHTPLRMAMDVDFQTTMVDDYLVKVDRASMLASLEVRAPFLDHRLIEFAFRRVPDHLRATARRRKILLRKLAAGLLPRELDLQRKQGFILPLAAWFRTDWGKRVEGVLREADPSILDQSVVAELLAGQRAGYNNANRLFLLLMFELWRREYRVSV